MKEFYIIFLIFGFIFSGIPRINSQSTDRSPDIVYGHIYEKVDQSPSFPGGFRALFEFIGKNAYLDIPYNYCVCKECNINKKPFVEFVVEKDGSLTCMRIIRGSDPVYNEKAIEVVEKMPHWIPGKLDGQPVRTLQVVFVPIRLTKIAPGHH